MKKLVVAGAPEPIGPYCHAVQTQGQLLILSGQIGITPTSGKLVKGGVKEEAAQALENVEVILHGMGLGWNDVVRVEIYLMDMSDFAEINEIYAKKFDSGSFPARQVVQVAGLPAGAKIEIVCTAEVTSDNEGNMDGHR